MLAITPTMTGPGVLARVTAAFAARGINMTSLISRPLKAAQGQYAFIVTFDAAPWSEPARGLLSDLLAAGDSLKTLGAYAPDGSRPTSPVDVDPEHLLTGSVTSADDVLAQSVSLLW
jgi:prephenate dehydratase/chorismate mutase/prephenate dehydratase